jgi:transposase
MEYILSEKLVEPKYLQRIQIVLGRIKGIPCDSLAYLLGIHPMTVSRVMGKYRAGGVNSLISDMTREPGKKPISDAVKRALIEYVLYSDGEIAPSSRMLADKFGISHMAVDAILHEEGISGARRLARGKEPRSAPIPDNPMVFGLFCRPPINLLFVLEGYSTTDKYRDHKGQRAEDAMRAQTSSYYTHPCFAAFRIACTGQRHADRDDIRKDAILFAKKVASATPSGILLHSVCERNQDFMLIRSSLSECFDTIHYYEHIIASRHRWLKIAGSILNDQWIARNSDIAHSPANSLDQALSQSFCQSKKLCNGFTWIYDFEKR